MARRARLGVGLLALLAASLPQAAEKVVCHVDYGGEVRRIEARPTTTPYTVPTQAIGSFFRFRIVFRREPLDLAGIKIYTYADRDGEPALIHQASHPYPATNAASHGFSGLNFVYETQRDGELHYWCELIDAEVAP